MVTSFTQADELQAEAGEHAETAKRFRARAVQGLLANWDGILPGLRAHMLSRSMLLQRQRHALVRSRQQFFEAELRTRGWACSKCPTGKCTLSENFTLFPVPGSTGDNTSLHADCPCVLYVDTSAHFSLAVPTVACGECRSLEQLQPDHVLAWPGTPERPSVWYSYDLLEEACHTKCQSPIGVRKFCEIRVGSAPLPYR